TEKREKQWAEERQDFGGVRCSSLSPPKPSNVQPQVTGWVGGGERAEAEVEERAPASDRLRRRSEGRGAVCRGRESNGPADVLSREELVRRGRRAPLTPARAWPARRGARSGI